MVFQIVDFAATFLEVLIFLLITTNYSYQRFPLKYSLIPTCVLYCVLIIVLNNYSLYSWLSLIVCPLLMGLVSLIVNKTNKMFTFSLGVVYATLLGILDFLVLTVVEIVGDKIGFTLEIITSFSVKRIIYIAFMKMLLIIFYVVFVKFIPKNKDIKAGIKMPIFLMAFGVTCLFCINSLVSALISNDVNQLKLSYLLCWVIMFLFIILLSVIFVLYQNNQKQMAEKELVTVSQQISEQKYVQTLQNFEENAKSFHDFKNQISTMKLLLESEQYSSARKYIEEIDKSVKRKKFVVFTGSQIVDALLNSEEQKAEEKGVKIEIGSEFQIVDDKMEMDLCTVLSNLIDNAIEASERELKENRKVEVNIKKVKDFLSICISNYCSTSPILHNSDLKTTKEDKKMHGIGLKNVKAVVSKHNGLMKNEYKDSKFIVDVVL